MFTCYVFNFFGDLFDKIKTIFTDRAQRLNGKWNENVIFFLNEISINLTFPYRRFSATLP